LKIGKEFFDGVGNFDYIAPRLAHDHQPDGSRAALLGHKPGSILVVFHAVDDVRHILKAYRRFVAVCHDERPECFGIHELSCGADIIGLVGAIQDPGWSVDVPTPERAVNLIYADLLGNELLGVDLDSDRVFRGAHNLDFGHPVDHRDRLSQRDFGVIIQHPHREGR
jgi:hypothetical protein